MFPCAIALGQHAPGGLGGDGGRNGLEPASLFDPRPEFPQSSELGDGEELVLVGREPKVDGAPRVFELDAVRLERAQVGDGLGEHEAEFLRLRAAGGVDRPAVGHGKRTFEAFLYEASDETRDRWGKLAPRLLRAAANGHGADRIETEARFDGGGSEPLGDHVRGDKFRSLHRRRTEIELDRNAPVEAHAGERSRRSLASVAGSEKP